MARLPAIRAKSKPSDGAIKPFAPKKWTRFWRDSLQSNPTAPEELLGYASLTRAPVGLAGLAAGRLQRLS